MQAYPQVEEYMKTVGLKYIKNSQEFMGGLAACTSRQYALDMANLLNSRAEGAPTDNNKFYALKNETLKGSVYISAAFDGGVFRHIGNMVIDNVQALNGNVLDLACDCGIVTCFMAMQCPDSYFTGVDINEKAINNAKELAEKLGINNVDFKCVDIYEMNLEKEFDAITSFRCLLDVADKKTKPLSFIGERSSREAQYQEAFSDYSAVISKHLKNGGRLFSVERYTADYGWLGYMQSLNDRGIYMCDGCTLMRAQDISSVKEYSVTIAVKDEGKTAMQAYEEALGSSFKSGQGYDGGMAEFALYYDRDGEIEMTEVLKKSRVIHVFAFATAKNGKRMYYDASADVRKIKYYNPKKEESMQKDFDKKCSLFDTDIYEFRKITV